MADNAPPTTRAATRAGRNKSSRAKSGSRGRVLLIGGVIVVVIGVGAYFVLGAGKDGPTYTASESVTLTVGPTAMNTVGFPGGMVSVAISAPVMATLNAYVQSAIVDPLRKGKSNNDSLGKVFDLAALGRLSGADRAVVLDEGLPKAIGKITVTAPPVPLTGLASIGEGGASVVLISADVQLAVQAQSANGVVGVTRNGSFVLAPAADGTWKITGWTLSTERRGPGTAAGVTTTSGKAGK